MRYTGAVRRRSTTAGRIAVRKRGRNAEQEAVAAGVEAIGVACCVWATSGEGRWVRGWYPTRSSELERWQGAKAAFSSVQDTEWRNARAKER